MDAEKPADNSADDSTDMANHLGSAPMVVEASALTTKATADRFTGDVWVDGITGGHGTGTPTLSTVRFAPSARTAWHCHSHGQTLHVTDGYAIVQTRQGQTVLMRAGDTVYTPPGTWHWHGAAPGSFMTHLALSVAGGSVDWGEHVSDDDYAIAATTGVDESRGNQNG